MTVPVEVLLAGALRSRRTLVALRRAVTSDLAVANPWYLQVMRFASDHLEQHGEVPLQGDADLWIASQDVRVQDSLRAAWRKLVAVDLTSYTEDALAEYAVESLREEAARVAVQRLTAHSATGRLSSESVLTIADQLRAIRPVTLDGIVDLADVSAHLPVGSEDGQRIESGIEKLDQVLGGGFMRELVFLMAGTGVGKTTFLVNRLVNAALRGAHCFHLTLELTAAKTLHRYYRRIATAHRGEFFTDIDNVTGRVQHWLRLAEGSVRVLYRPAYTMTSDDVLATCETFADLYGGLDVFALDYLDLLDSPKAARGLRRDEQLGILSHEVRTICTTMDVEVITASQANREGLNADRLTLKHMAGAIAKAQAADVVIGLVQDENEAANRQARLGFLKMRDYPGRGAEIPVFYDMDTMTIMDLDHPSARLRRAQMEAEWQRARIIDQE